MGSEWPLDGSHVRLRALRLEDVETVSRNRGDSEVARFQSWETYSRSDAEALIEKVRRRVPDQPGEWFQFGIAIRETGELVGDCALHCPVNDLTAAEIGFTLGREFWSRGYAREAISLLLDWLFEQRMKQRVFAITDGRNRSAHLLLQRLGFRRESEFDRMVWFKGEFGPECVWGVRRQQEKPKKAMNIPIHDETTAPEAARETLQTMRGERGFITNLAGVMAGSPALLKGYLELGSLFNETSFSATERQVVLLAASRENVCHYCMAGHSTASAAADVPPDVVDAIRNDEAIEDAKLEALRQLTSAIVESRGWPSADVVSQFLSAGYAEQQILEVVLGVGVKTLSNYTNHLADTPVNEQFAKNRWQPPVVADETS